MTVKDFQEKYHDYTTEDQMEATIDAMKLRVLDEDGKERKVIPVKIDGAWCLMIDTAAAIVKELGLER